MKRNQRYRNPLKVDSMVGSVLVILTLGAVGSAYVYMKNRHVKTGDAIHAIESEIRDIDKEVQMLRTRLAEAEALPNLERRLAEAGSVLSEIDPGRVVEISPHTGGGEVAMTVVQP